MKEIVLVVFFLVTGLLIVTLLGDVLAGALRVLGIS